MTNLDQDKIEESICIICDIINYPAWDVVLVITGDEELQEMNHTMRGIHSPTDTLSF